MIDLYRILPEEFFEQIGDFDTNEEKYAPINYEEVTMSLYEPNSFFGPECTYLHVDDEEKFGILRFAKDNLSAIMGGKLCIVGGNQ